MDNICIGSIDNHPAHETGTASGYTVALPTYLPTYLLEDAPFHLQKELAGMLLLGDHHRPFLRTGKLDGLTHSME